MHLGLAAETTLSMDDLKRLPANFDKALLYSMQCVEMIPGEFAEVTNLETGMATQLRWMSRADYNQWKNEVKFDVTSIDSFEAKIKEFIRTQTEHILSNTIKPLKDQVSTYLRELVAHSIMQNKNANLGFLYQAFEVVARDIPAYIQSVMSGEVEQKLIDGSTSEEDRNAASQRINDLNKQLQVKYLLNGIYMRLLLASDPDSDFLDKAYGTSMALVSKALQELTQHRMWTDRVFAEEYIPQVFMRMLGTKNRDRNYFYTSVFIQSTLTSLINQSPVPIRRAVSKALLSGSTLPETERISSHKYYPQFADFIETLKLSKGVSFENDKQESIFQFDFLATNAKSLEFAEFTEKQWETLMRVSSNINSVSYFLKYFKYFPTQKDQNPEKFKASVMPLYAHLYKAFVESRNQELLFTQKDWDNFMDKHYYRRYHADTERFLMMDMKNNKDDKTQVKFIGMSIILTKLLFGNKLIYYYMQYEEGTVEWLYTFYQSDDFVIDYTRLYRADKYVPIIGGGISKHLVIPCAGRLSRTELEILRKSETMRAIAGSVQAGKSVMKMTDLESSFESDVEVFVYVMERGVSREEFLKHISE